MSLFGRLKSFEGYRRYAYRDHLGHLTIGYGTMIEAPGQGISKDAAEYLMVERVNQIYAELNDLDWFVALDAERQECMVEMAYQMGVSGLLGFRKMIAALAEGDFDEASQEALDSLWAEQTPMRAQDVAERIRGE